MSDVQKVRLSPRDIKELYETALLADEDLDDQGAVVLVSCADSPHAACYYLEELPEEGVYPLEGWDDEEEEEDA